MLVMKGNESGHQDLSSYSMNPKKPSGRLLFFVVFFLLIIGMLVGLFFIGYSRRSVSTTIPTSDMSESLPTSSVPVAAKGRERRDGAGRTGLDRKELSVAILNGSGDTSTVTAVSDYLKGLGYKVVSVGNVDGFTHKGLIVTVKRNKSAYARLLKGDLQENLSFVDVSASVDDDISADAEVIVGSN